jgi:uncharacterized protein YebE (UPF0316 family)
MFDLLPPTLDPSGVGLLAALEGAWRVVLPAALVACLRMMDVTLNVFRTVFTVNGRKYLAAIAHGMEGAVWLTATGIVLSDLTITKTVGFIAGIMLGTLVGTSIVERLRLGMVTVRIYADASHDEGSGAAIADAIRAAGFGATTFTGEGMNGPVKMVLSTVPRRRAGLVVAAATDVSSHAVVAIDNDLQSLATPARA